MKVFAIGGMRSSEKQSIGASKESALSGAKSAAG
jgi:hypothetical protein